MFVLFFVVNFFCNTSYSFIYLFNLFILRKGIGTAGNK